MAKDSKILYLIKGWKNREGPDKENIWEEPQHVARLTTYVLMDKMLDRKFWEYKEKTKILGYWFEISRAQCFETLSP